MSRIYGDKVQLGAFPCRFPEVQIERKEGGYQIEILVPIAQAKAVQDALYGDNEKLINFNKANEKAKVPQKLWSPVYLYDEEKKEAIVDEETGDKVVDEDFVVFRFKSQWKPKIQFKKGLNSKALIGAGSIVKIVGSVFSSDEKKDENGKTLKYTLLSLVGIRVDTIIEPKAGGYQFEEDDEYADEEDVEDSDYEEEETEEEEPEEPEEAPKSKGKAKGKRNF